MLLASVVPRPAARSASDPSWTRVAIPTSMQSTPAVALPSQNATATATPRQQATSADASEDESSWSPKTSAGTTHARTPRARAEIGLLDETTLIPNPTNRAAASGDAVGPGPPSAQNRYPRKTLISPPALLGGSPSWGRFAPEGTGGRPSPVSLSNGARSSRIAASP